MAAVRKEAEVAAVVSGTLGAVSLFGITRIVDNRRLGIYYILGLVLGSWVAITYF